MLVRTTPVHLMVQTLTMINSIILSGFNCLTFVAPASDLAAENSSCFISVINRDLYVHCLDSLMSGSPSRRQNILYVYRNHS